MKKTLLLAILIITLLTNSFLISCSQTPPAGDPNENGGSGSQGGTDTGDTGEGTGEGAGKGSGEGTGTTQISYSVSEYSDLLTQKSLNAGFSTEYDLATVPYDLITDEELAGMGEIVFLDVTDKKSCYTCAYVSADLLPLLDGWYGDQSPFSSWYGKDWLLAKYVTAGMGLSPLFEYAEYPLTWYEIPLNETPPDRMGDQVLVMITLDYTVTVTAADGTLLHSAPMFIEQSHLYESSSDRAMEAENKLSTNTRYYWLRRITEDKHVYETEEVWISNNLEMLTWTALLESKEIDGETRVHVHYNSEEDKGRLADLSCVDISVPFGANTLTYHYYLLEDILDLLTQ